MSQETPRIATIEDLDGVTATLSMAFRDDPVWSLWAFPEPSALEACWRFVIQTSLRYPTTWVVGEYAAAAVWIPPGGSVVPGEQEAAYERLVGELVGPRAAEVMELDERFEAVHPHDRPHYYLPLLGTHPDHRGRGLGMRLLAHNLAQFDAEGIPTYLPGVHRLRQAEERLALGLGKPGRSDLVFTDTLSEPIKPDSFSQFFDRRMGEARAPEDQTSRTPRHTRDAPACFRGEPQDGVFASRPRFGRIHARYLCRSPAGTRGAGSHGCGGRARLTATRSATNGR